MMSAAQFLECFATPLVEELRAIEGLKKFTTNSDVIGAHAEAVVRRLVRRVVEPLRVSTGAVISPELCVKPNEVPQLDTIIWLPCPAPALFEVGEFGLVPRGSSMAVMEIKRSAYKGVGENLKSRLNSEFVQRIVADNPPGWPEARDPTMYPDFPALGVICLRETQDRDRKLEEIVAQGLCVIILEQRNANLVPNCEAIYRLINFLIRARQRALAWDGKSLINMAALGRNG
ncbi:MAG: hypothetical protein ACM3VT_12895 [Solirubrobacterales bacterium]